MIKNYFKVAFRNLWKNKSYGFLNIFGLAIGIACAGLIFLWVEDELSYNKSYVKRNQLYQVYVNHNYEGKISTFAAMPGLLAPAMQQELPGIKNTSRFTWDQYTLFTVGEKAIYERGYYADSNAFSMFGFEFLQGKADQAFDQLHSIVISEKMAKKFFGNDQNIIGKTIKVDNKEDYVITGVIKDLPENSTLKFDWLCPFKNYLDRNEWLNSWTNNGILTYVELDKQANITALAKKLERFIYTKDTSATARPFLFAMKDWRLYNDFQEGKQVGGRIKYVKLFSTIAWIILVIACINFMNLATARSEARAKEVGVRKVLGAARKTLIGQFIGEAFFMSFLSAFVAVIMMYFFLKPFNDLVQKDLSVNLFAPQHIISLLIIVFVCGLIAGSYPAVYLSSFNPMSVFKRITSKLSSPVLIRKGLVVLQFSISIALIIGTIIIYQQIQHVKSRELGYDKERLIQTALRGEMQNHFPVIKQQLLATGYVENAAMSNLNMLYMGSNSSGYEWEGKEKSKKILITQDMVSPDYIKTMGIKIKQGRDFYPVAKQDSANVIVNQTLADMIDKRNAVGKYMMKDSVKLTIIGVTNDLVFDDMYGKSEPIVFYSYPEWYGYIYIKYKAGADIEKAISKTESIVKANNPGFPFNYTFVDQEFDRIFKTESLIGKLAGVFAILAIIISCLGLFGLAAYTAERRTKEIGIRKVLGATVTGITQLISKDFLKLVLISAVVAFPIAWWAMHNWLLDYAYRISISWWVFIFSGLLAMIIALMTISFQSIKAAVANPVKSLRTE